MPGVLDRHPPVAREPAVHLGRVLVGDVVRQSRRRPTAPARRTTRRRARRPATRRARPSRRPSRSRLSCQRQPSPSRRRFCSRKLRTVGVGHRLAQRLVGLVAPLERREVEGAHRLDVAHELAPRGVRRRRHVDDHEPLDQLGVAQREHHRDLAAHRVPDQRHRAPRPRSASATRSASVEVVERLGPRRAAVVGHVDQQHPVVAAEVLGDLRPVLALPEQAVAEGDDRPRLAESGHVQCGGAHAGQSVSIGR